MIILTENVYDTNYNVVYHKNESSGGTENFMLSIPVTLKMVFLSTRLLILNQHPL